MQDAIRAAVLKLFPELSGGLHLDRYARVVAIADQPEKGATCERFRPRYAVDIEILTPDLEPDPAFPVYPAVPLPVPSGAGQEAGTFAFPEPGALVVVGFAYGRPDHPIIRHVYPMGTSLPAVAPREWLAQQSPAVFQRADAAGNWVRRTDAGIEDDSLTRLVRAVEAVTELAREFKRIEEHSTIEVGGMRTVEVGTVLTMLAGLRADLGTLGDLNLSAGADSTHTTAGEATETVGQNHTSTVKGNRSVAIDGDRQETVQGEQETTIGGGRTETVTGEQTTDIGGAKTETIGADLAVNVTGNSTEIAAGNKVLQAANVTLGGGAITLVAGTFACMGSGGGGGSGPSLFAEILACLDEIKAALTVLASHTHPTVGAIVQGGTVSGHVASLEEHRNIIGGITA
ncbi:bacteriophage T4 gp5 trimerisation domain-containing protein [Desulfocurvibacter africanus]|uniref:bacteriophage T4 gp5 trimerisation domain-containing protein n=1 Tax=Desulfocurvibacter africanus TaxID=873 RepID=UPI000415230E|nr:hypothetical protein [Desulfocurvibacter africanus]